VSFLTKFINLARIDVNILTKFAPFVKDHANFHAARALEYQTSSPSRAKRHKSTADTLQQMLGDFDLVVAEFQAAAGEIVTLKAENETLKEQLRIAQSAPSVTKAALRLSLNEEDVQGLPQELIKELSLSDGDRTEFAILNILEESNGISTLDRLLIGLYHRTKEIHKRDKLVSRLYRMAQKNLIYSVPQKKGVYSLEPPAGTVEEIPPPLGTNE
jgi:hypothetical protein